MEASNKNPTGEWKSGSSPSRSSIVTDKSRSHDDVTSSFYTPKESMLPQAQSTEPPLPEANLSAELNVSAQSLEEDLPSHLMLLTSDSYGGPESPCCFKLLPRLGKRSRHEQFFTGVFKHDSLVNRDQYQDNLSLPSRISSMDVNTPPANFQSSQVLSVSGEIDGEQSIPGHLRPIPTRAIGGSSSGNAAFTGPSIQTSWPQGLFSAFEKISDEEKDKPA